MSSRLLLARIPTAGAAMTINQMCIAMPDDLGVKLSSLSVILHSFIIKLCDVSELSAFKNRKKVIGGPNSPMINMYQINTCVCVSVFVHVPLYVWGYLGTQKDV